jgi:hypothetical protein
MRQILVLLGILFTLTLKAQEEFSRAYLNVLISYDDSLSFYSGANAFTFNVDGNSILYYPHSGETERFIYVSGIMEDKDRYGDEYQMIKTIEVKTPFPRASKPLHSIKYIWKRARPHDMCFLHRRMYFLRRYSYWCVLIFSVVVMFFPVIMFGYPR